MQVKYIATTAQSEFWSKSDPILLLGSWCRLGLDKIKPPEYSELPCIWETDFSVEEAEKYCWNIFRRLIPDLAWSLNRLHGVNRSERYWEIALSLWFLHFINVMYDRYLLVKSALKAAKNAWTTVVSRVSYIIPPTSFDAVQAYAYEDQHNLQLFSEIYRFLGLNTFEYASQARKDCKEGLEGQHRFTLRSLPVVLKNNALEAMINFLQWMRVIASRNGDGLLFYANHQLRERGDLLILSILSGATIYIRHSNWNLAQRHKPSLERRRQVSNDLSGHSSADEFEALVLDSAPYFVPTCFIEGYKQLVSGSVERFGQRPRALVFDAPAFYVDPFFAEYAARCAESGKLLVSVQHGGVYGHTASSPAERIEVELCDHFISFGWKDDRFPERTVSLPCPHLTSLRRATQPGDSILYISFFGKPYLHRLVTVPHASQWDNYLEYCETFLKALPPHKLAKVRFRSYFDYGGYRIPPLMESLMKGRQQENRLASHALSDCRVAVIDHAATSWLEALASNTPTILFWNPAHWRFRAAAIPFVEDLYKMGILHYDPGSAAQKLEEIYDYVDEWWHEDERQRVRIAFCERYAWTTSHWRRHWSAALRSLNCISGRC